MGHWFDSPFDLIATPTGKLPEGQKPDVINDISSEMANAHNMFLRTLNALYLQAPYIAPSDTTYFLSYAQCLFIAIHHHHEAEEAHIFPAIEKLSGATGIMDANIAQHRLFHAAMDAMTAYIDACLVAKKDKYDGARFQELCMSLGPVLREHLADEIATLEDLRQYGVDRMAPLTKAFEESVKASSAKIGLMTVMPAMYQAVDKSFEGGLWKDFPPVPFVINLLIRNVFVARHPSWWKFTPCDVYMQPRPHPYARPAEAK